MKTIKKRAYSALVIAALLILGMFVYLARYITDGESWATFSGNQAVYAEGRISVGTVTDRNGVVLAHMDGENKSYSESAAVRVSTLHALGDFEGYIGTGALTQFASRLTGYSAVGGVSPEGETIALTIDSELHTVAYEALAGRRGAVLVMDYETGEVLCMVSTPSYDPTRGFDEADEAYSGAYINRCISSVYTPGSVFKIVTLAAALENIGDIYDREFSCSGSVNVGGMIVNCTGTHGAQTIEVAFANSCNCAFAELSLELGGDTLLEYAEGLGLASELEISGITTAAGHFEASADGTPDLAWSGIGQSTDLVSPYAMLRLAAAIARGGELAEPTLLSGEGGGTERLLDAETADAIARMLSYNVHYAYGGDELFPGLELCAKSGTAEVGGGSEHSWFVGFLDDPETPCAFAVVIENGGSGLRNAGAVANAVLQALVNMER